MKFSFCVNISLYTFTLIRRKNFSKFSKYIIFKYALYYISYVKISKHTYIIDFCLKLLVLFKKLQYIIYHIIFPPPPPSISPNF